MNAYKPCPHCGQPVLHYRNPIPTVDIIIFSPPEDIVLIQRKNPPLGWALPGGFIDYGESADLAARREAKEETGLNVVLDSLLGVYSNPDRDPRQHTMSTVFTAHPETTATLEAGDDAAATSFFSLFQLPELAFDHLEIIKDFILIKKKMGLAQLPGCNT